MGLVAVGCLIEGYEYFAGHEDDERSRRRMQRAGLLTLLMGLGLEFVADWRTTVLSAPKEELLTNAIAQRVLSPSQFQSLIAALKQLPGQPIQFVTFNGDVELERIAGQIEAALRNAGWDPHGDQVESTPKMVVGIWVNVLPGSNGAAWDTARALVSALRSVHLATGGPNEGRRIPEADGKGDGLPVVPLELIIGKKP
jgi:hypothetical protein